MSVVIETTLGDITVDLYLYERPRACSNFLKLCKLKYYNFNLFHTISRGFIAQTGDPTGSRTGGETIYGILEGPSKRYFEAENEPRIKHTKPGLISFVGDADKMIGSQFFFTLGEDLTYLDEKHCVFGEVVEGFEILEEINEVICDTDDRPYQDVRISHTVVLDDPYPDPNGLMVPSRSPSPSAERLQGGRIAPDEDIDETAGKSAKEIAEMQAEREAKARATILEMVGDIPDAEIAPPENVLFVCKLNPTTNDDDLEIIFSRFGKIKSCEVICDRKSGDSLQYAFIEFEERKSCEEAYFKMDNVLIDDRRIHVDFSQSVSKVRWLGKGRITYFDKGSKNDFGKGIYKKADMHEKNKTVEANNAERRGGNIDRSIKVNSKRQSSSPSEKRKQNLFSISRKHERSRERLKSSPQQGGYSKKGRSRSRSLEKQRERRQIRSRSRSLEKQREKRQYRTRSPDQGSSRTSKRSYVPSDRKVKNNTSDRSRRSRSPVNKSVGSSKRRDSRSPARSSSRTTRRKGEIESTSRKPIDRNLPNLSPKRKKRSRTPIGNVPRNKSKKSKPEKSSDDSDTDHKAQSKRLKKDKRKKKSKAKKKKIDSSDSDSSDSESEEVVEKKSKHKKKRKRKISHDTDSSDQSSDSSSSSSSSSDSSSSYKNSSKRKKTASKKRKKRK